MNKNAVNIRIYTSMDCIIDNRADFSRNVKIGITWIGKYKINTRRHSCSIRSFD